MLKQVSYAALGIAVVLLLMIPPSASGQPSSGPQIRLQMTSFDPLQNPPADVDSQEADGLGVYLIQFQGPIKPVWRQAVTAAGAELFDYVPDYAFIARMDAATAKRVSALPAVRSVGPYLPAYRISPSLQRGLAGQSADGDELEKPEPLEVRVSLFPAETETATHAVQATGGDLLRSAETSLGGTLRALIPPAAIAELARSPAVRWIEPAPQRRLLNDVARSEQIMNAKPAWNAGLFGSGQIVALADTGLDVGDTVTLSRDFRGRVLSAHPLGDGKTTWNDSIGHGTHVAGSIAGNGALSGSNPQAHDYVGSFAGIAPEASLVIQAFDIDEETLDIEGLPENLNVLFQQAYDAGARIHSNSWGGSDEDNEDNPFGGYTLDAQQADEFTWSHPDMTILFAAGNSGKDVLPESEFLPGDGVVDSDSLNVPGTAKNVVTVGASESLRPPQGDDDLSSRNMQWLILGLFDFLRPPIALDYVSDNLNGMAAFSSRGPTDDGRIKPDVVAPGTNIVSARSQDPGFDPFFESWGPYEEDPDYVYNGGTSMSTPLAAGAATLMREWYVERHGLPNPSSALIKATLINGAADLTPGQYGTGDTREIPLRPNNVEGWGRINLPRSLAGSPQQRVWFDDHRAGLQTGERVTYEDDAYSLDLLYAGVPLQVTLVWTDYPGVPAAAKQLVNDLDLTVVGPDGREWHGNGIDADRTNNVEGVDIARPALGHYRIVVEGHNVPHGPQPYALVVAGGLSREGVIEFFVPLITR